MNSLTCLQYNTYNFQAERHGLSTVYISTLKPCNVSYMHTKKHDDLTEHSKVFDNINFSGFLLERCHPPFFCRRKVGVQRAALSPSEKGRSFHGPQGPPKKRNSHHIFFPAIEESQPKISKRSWISRGLWKHRISRNLVKTFRRFTFGSDQQCFWMHFVAQNERLGLVGRSLGGKFRWFFFRTKKKGVAKERRGKFHQKTNG